MLRYTGRRLLWAIPTLLIITFLVFLAIRAGTDPVASYLRINPRASAAKIQQYKEVNGLIGSRPEQYFRWLKHFVTGDWGNSIKGNRPVWPSIKDAMANTLVLGIVASVVGIGIGLGIGILAALRPYTKFDTTATTGAFIGISIPPFVAAVLLQLFFCVYMTKWLHMNRPVPTDLGRVPAGSPGLRPGPAGQAPDTPRDRGGHPDDRRLQPLHAHASCSRSRTPTTCGPPGPRGSPSGRVIVKHGLRNALIPIITVAALDIGAIIGGLIITERIFEYRGMGDFFLTALEQR